MTKKKVREWGWKGASRVPPKLLGNVLFDYGHAVESFLAHFFVGFEVVLAEVGDVFRVGEVFFAGVWGRIVSEWSVLDLGSRESKENLLSL